MESRLGVPAPPSALEKVTPPPEGAGLSSSSVPPAGRVSARVGVGVRASAEVRVRLKVRVSVG